MNGFQSTHSLRSATDGSMGKTQFETVSIHALLAECDQTCEGLVFSLFGFNPRTPCGVRPNAELVDEVMGEFQSTHSLRSATKEYLPEAKSKRVSIHALLAECDGSGFE